MININGRQYDDVAASKAAKQFRDQLQAVHKAIETYEQAEDGPTAAAYRESIVEVQSKAVKLYLNTSFIIERRVSKRREAISGD